MSVIVRNKVNNKNLLFIKGAPDYLLKKSKFIMSKGGKLLELNENSRNVIEGKIKDFAKRGLRTLAICMKAEMGPFETYSGPLHESHKLLLEPKNYAEYEKNGIILGVVAVRDPPRKEVKDAIQKCKNAGISVIMITGDIKETAESIAKDINIIKEGDQATRSLTGAEYSQMTDEQKITAFK